MLIKLTGHATGRPVLIESDALIYAEETEDTFRGRVYTRLDLVIDQVKISSGVKESCEEIYAAIEENESGEYL